MKTKILASFLSAFLAGTAAVQGGMLVSFDTATVTHSDVYETIGFTFSVTAPLLVDGLGTYDAGKNGLAGSAAVGLWDSSRHLLATITVPAGVAAPLDNWFRWWPLAEPLTLAPGAYVVGALTSAVAEPFAYFAVGMTTVPNVNYVHDSYVTGATLRFPELSEDINVGVLGRYKGWFGGNVHVSVPEGGGSTALGFASGLLALGFAVHPRMVRGTSTVAA